MAYLRKESKKKYDEILDLILLSIKKKTKPLHVLEEEAIELCKNHFSNPDEIFANTFASIACNLQELYLYEKDFLSQLASNQNKRN